MINQHSENLLNTQLEKAPVQGYKFSWFDWFCLWYPPGWLILFNRHWQHYHQDPDGWHWLEYGLFLIPGGFYLAMLSRWLRLGCRSPRQEVGEFDANYQQAFRQEVIGPIVKYYFRGELQQIENVPPKGPLIVAMNHAGMCFPWDFLTLAYLLGEARGWKVQPLANPALFDHPWMVWWLPSKWSQVLGGVRAELNDFEVAIAQGKILLYAPEGIRGPAKGWRKRHQLQKFEVSFVQLSDRYHIPILPVVCIGSEFLHPWTFNITKLQRLIKLPFLPFSPLMLALLLFPSMGVWAMKTRLRYFIQPLEPGELGTNSNKGRTAVYQQAQKLREKLQFQINQLLQHIAAC
ncbi:MAG: 1-acyl-sn-glycerol-3-phosphate acyltransferase [Nostoc sp. ZfuVER08]|uniref:1-acyl-sn-glycerol-3-phosphate acyltransferase n=1 Tax=Nostoc punctiforme FACHB-252 TaxID=1357509 RepID=A0ABR8HBH1_NOSPU|nr:1-acyl-sn-glycerol-3-phosphate acyltransferase [Nostoc punctiforme]MBD2612956.1 1-acyl-sn-glycerol-3-phosphate acyltransferase [Nostoc punctiforme FACHB-252]MDZ8012088.1 1-acyl-sn-glycerol-3-phosphate acyltransferase [Nostoc sp. ZfuVER08]